MNLNKWLLRRATAAAVAGAMVLSLCAPALAAAPPLPAFPASTAVLSQQNDASAAEQTFDLSEGSIKVEVQTDGTQKVTVGSTDKGTVAAGQQVVITQSDNHTPTDHTITVDGTGTAYITLAGVNISADSLYAFHALLNCSCALVLTLAANTENTLKSNNQTVGFALSSPSNLTITGSGTLTVLGAQAGIISDGSISIQNGATVNANVNTDSSAAGKSGLYSNSEVIIDGATVNANGSDCGIYSNNNLEIKNGATVNANTDTTGSYGLYSYTGTVSIDGSTVKANGTTHGIYSSGDLTIRNGSTVEANGSNNPGSCGLYSKSYSDDSSNTITIDNSNVRTTRIGNSSTTAVIKGSSKVLLTDQTGIDKIVRSDLTSDGWLAYPDGASGLEVIPTTLDASGLTVDSDPAGFTSLPAKPLDLSKGSIVITANADGSHKVTVNGTDKGTFSAKQQVIITSNGAETANTITVEGDGTAKITLQNVKINTQNTTTNALSAACPLQLTLKGENTLSGKNGICGSTDRITLTGDGTLNANGSSNGITNSVGSVTVEECSVNANGGLYGIDSHGDLTIQKGAAVNANIGQDGTAAGQYGLRSSTGKVTIADSTVKADGYYGIDGEEGIAITGSADVTANGSAKGMTSPGGVTLSDKARVTTTDLNGKPVTITGDVQLTLTKPITKAALDEELDYTKLGEGGKITYTDPDGKQHTTSEPEPGGSGTDKPSTDGPSSKPGTDKPGTDDPSSKPGTDKPGTDDPSSKPGTDKPGTDDPSSKPGTDKPGTDDPSSKPGTDEPDPTPGEDDPGPTPGEDPVVISEGETIATGIALAATGGAVLVGGYFLTTGLLLNSLLPEGAAVPTSRAELALLVWNTAGSPAPAASLPDTDDAAKAMQWCTEQGYLDGTHPDWYVPKYRIIEVWNKAFPKQ